MYNRCVSRGYRWPFPEDEPSSPLQFAASDRDLLQDSGNPYNSLQWYKGEVPDIDYIEEGIEGLNKSWPGDIVTDGFHIGIISGPSKTIHVSETKNIVIEDEWGWRKEDLDKVKIFRYSADK